MRVRCSALTWIRTSSITTPFATVASSAPDGCLARPFALHTRSGPDRMAVTEQGKTVDGSVKEVGSGTWRRRSVCLRRPFARGTRR